MNKQTLQQLLPIDAGNIWPQICKRLSSVYAIGSICYTATSTIPINIPDHASGNRFSKHARGILVLRYDPEGCEIVDLIAPLAEIPLLITHARRLAGMHGARRVFCRITANFADYFSVAGGTQQTVNIHIPANAWSNGPSPKHLKITGG
ncbi:MAG: hypothetical protein IPP22_10990 [Nitrosomonas sp.]|nr:hypothetical protein [Nitrosomonas sp.]